MFGFLRNIFGGQKENIEFDPMKYLIAGLGNIGSDYEGTRHNIGFEVVDLIAQKLGISKWDIEGNAAWAEGKHKGRTILLIKPTTYMNRSGKAVSYWMNKHKIERSNILVVLDDLNIDFGTLRLKEKGSDGGHNGLKDIDATLSGNNYARLRVGIGNDYGKGQQVNFVLGRWDNTEKKDLPLILENAADAALSFASIGAKFTMEKYNKNFLKG